MYIRFPYQVNSLGQTAGTNHSDHIRDLIEQVIFTTPGERVNRPTFGSGLNQLVFEPNSVELAATVQFLVKAALQQWLSDVIEVGEVQITTEDTQLQILITYRELLSPVVQTVTFNRSL